MLHQDASQPKALQTTHHLESPLSTTKINELHHPSLPNYAPAQQLVLSHSQLPRLSGPSNNHDPGQKEMFEDVI